MNQMRVSMSSMKLKVNLCWRCFYSIPEEKREDGKILEALIDIHRGCAACDQDAVWSVVILYELNTKK